MLNYVNSVSCSANPNNNEFILGFRQIHPVVDSTGAIVENHDDLLCEAVLNRDTALALLNMLAGVLQKGNEA